MMLLWAAAAPAAAQPMGDDAASRQQQMRQTVDEVLAGRQFKGLHESEGQWLRWLLGRAKALLEAIGNLFRELPDWLWWVLLIWMVLTLLAILGHVAYTLWLTLGQPGRRGGPEGRGRRRGESWLGVRDLDFASVYERAVALRQAGQWAEAIRYLYVAAILWLDEAGAIAFRQSKTNGDYLRELREKPEHLTLLRGMTGVFEATVYGGAAATKQSCEQMAGTVDRMVETRP